MLLAVAGRLRSGTVSMPGKGPGPSIKNPAVYEALKKKGYSKSSAAAISNAQSDDDEEMGDGASIEWIARAKDQAMRDKEFSAERRKTLAKSGKAMPGGGFPIESEQDLRNAIHAIGRASNPAAAKAHIKKRARALGKSDLIPENWDALSVEDTKSCPTCGGDGVLASGSICPTCDGQGSIQPAEPYVKGVGPAGKVNTRLAVPANHPGNGGGGDEDTERQALQAIARHVRFGKKIKSMMAGEGLPPSLEDALPPQFPCPACHGTGKDPDADSKLPGGRCDACGGTGYIDPPNDNSSHWREDPGPYPTGRLEVDRRRPPDDDDDDDDDLEDSIIADVGWTEEARAAAAAARQHKAAADRHNMHANTSAKTVQERGEHREAAQAHKQAGDLYEKASGILRRGGNANGALEKARTAGSLAKVTSSNIGSRHFFHGRDAEAPMAMRDSIRLVVDQGNIRKSKDGYLVASARIARTGIQLYDGREVGRPDLDTVRVYRPPDEVFSKKTMQSLAHKPITLEHPPQMVDAGNWDKYAIGHIGDEVTRDGDTVRVPMVIMDGKAIKTYERDGVCELSVGYSTELKWGQGATPDGEIYDAMQTAIRGNHLAVVPAARGGSRLRIGDDQQKGKPMAQILIGDRLIDFESEAQAKHVKDYIASIADVKKKDADEAEEEQEEEKKTRGEKDAAFAALKGENAVLKKQLEDALAKSDVKALDARAKERIDLLLKADAAMEGRGNFDGKEDAQIRREVVTAKLGDAAKDLSDAELVGAFRAVTANLKPRSGTDRLADSLSLLGQGGGADQNNPKALKDAAYQAYVKRQQDAWKTTPSAV